jgi:hypothetical protein
VTYTYRPSGQVASRQVRRYVFDFLVNGPRDSRWPGSYRTRGAYGGVRSSAVQVTVSPKRGRISSVGIAFIRGFTACCIVGRSRRISYS